MTAETAIGLEGRKRRTQSLRSRRRKRVALVTDPRFPGGTASAVAAEIEAIAPHVDLSLHGLETAMFKNRPMNPALERAVTAMGVPVYWNSSVVRADLVVFHNPACLKFNHDFPVRFSCERGVVVTHENFLRPNGSEGFDIGKCLGFLRDAFVCSDPQLAPVSDYNRSGVREWARREGADWRLSKWNWFNICSHPIVPPTTTPCDRRGRHSRPGFEKFPPTEIMAAHFPSHAEYCAILGADTLLDDGDPVPKHWRTHRFGEREVDAFLREIDFFVYFTNPQWRESFGRVISEAIAAGKVVITDPGTGAAFGGAVVASDGKDVDALIREFVDNPAKYDGHVRGAQAALSRYSPEAFVDTVLKPALAEQEAQIAVL